MKVPEGLRGTPGRLGGTPRKPGWVASPSGEPGEFGRAKRGREALLEAWEGSEGSLQGPGRVQSRGA